MALADYQGFQPNPFQVVALFDRDSARAGGKSPNGIAIYHINDVKKIVARDNITIGVLCVPAEEAQEMSALVIAAGVKAILNFAPVRLNIESGVKVKTMDLSMSFESLSYFLASQPAGRPLDSPATTPIARAEPQVQ
jgi:redox-sensing transcriptional repressor